MSKQQKKNRLVLGHPLLLPGNLLCNIHKKAGQKSYFMLAAITYDEVVMIRLFTKAETIGTPPGRCYTLKYEIQVSESINHTFSADYQRLIIKDGTPLVELVNKHPNCMVGSVANADLNIIIEKILAAHTIASELKNKYFR